MDLLLSVSLMFVLFQSFDCLLHGLGCGYFYFSASCFFKLFRVDLVSLLECMDLFLVDRLVHPLFFFFFRRICLSLKGWFLSLCKKKRHLHTFLHPHISFNNTCNMDPIKTAIQAQLKM